MRALLFFCLIALSVPGHSRTHLNLEAGFAQNPYNRVAIPGNTGTKFNLAGSFDDQLPYYRLSLRQDLGGRHGVRVLYAPLQLTGERTYGRDLEFNGVTFAGAEETDTLYKFNSYRLTYYYRLKEEADFKLNLGFSAKVRDARIRLRNSTESKERSDLGFVPLFYLWSEYQWSNGLRLVFDFDGMAAPQGRAIDAALMVGKRFSSAVALNLGYRVIEGGADNDKVYSFAHFNFFFASLDLSF
jgi:hypothetical protein